MLKKVLKILASHDYSRASYFYCFKIYIKFMYNAQKGEESPHLFSKTQGVEG